MRDVTRLLEVELHSVGATLDVSAPDRAVLLVDGNQLRQALLNVIRNAIEAGGRALRLDVNDTPDHVRIALTDDGPGMTEQEASRAVDPFFSTKASGTGLGLAITKQILDDHDGSLLIRSSPGQGTTLSLHLPHSRNKDAPHVAHHPGRG